MDVYPGMFIGIFYNVPCIDYSVFHKAWQGSFGSAILTSLYVVFHKFTLLLFVAIRYIDFSLDKAFIELFNT